LRIGLIIYKDLNYPSGGFLYDKTLVRHLEKQGHQIDVIALAWPAYILCLLQNFNFLLLKKIKDANFDLLLQDELNHPSLFLFNRWIKAKIGIPIVSIVHHLRSSEERSNLSNKLYRAIESRYLNSLDALISNSVTTQHSVSVLVKKNMPILVAKPGGDRFNQSVSRDEIKSKTHDGGPFNIVFLGALIKRKSPHLIINALAELPNGPFRAYFVGSPDADPSYARSLLDLVRQHHLEKFVQFQGHQPKSELEKIMKKCHVLVVPSSYEGYGIAYVEAMGFGMPAIARSIGASQEIIVHQENGFLLEKEGSDELVEILALLNKDRDLLFRMSISARKRYEELPTWAASMSKIEKYLINIYEKNFDARSESGSNI